MIHDPSSVFIIMATLQAPETLHLDMYTDLHITSIDKNKVLGTVTIAGSLRMTGGFGTTGC